MYMLPCWYVPSRNTRHDSGRTRGSRARSRATSARRHRVRRAGIAGVKGALPYPTASMSAASYTRDPSRKGGWPRVAPRRTFAARSSFCAASSRAAARAAVKGHAAAAAARAASASTASATTARSSDARDGGMRAVTSGG